MASKVELVVEVKSSADKMWTALRDSTELFPKIFPEYKSIETVEGDGKSVGTVRLIKYAEGTYMLLRVDQSFFARLINQFQANECYFTM
jgi:hypothetical protein